MGTALRSAGVAAGLGALAAALWFVALAPAQAWKAEQARALLTAQTRTADLAQRLQSLRRDVAALSLASDFGDVWKATSPGEATALVQATLSDIARRHGIAFRAITPLRTDPIPLKQAVSFRLEAEATLDRLVAFLREAEYHSPVLVFERGALRRLTKPGPPTKQPLVSFQFDVTAAFDIVGDG